MLTYSHLPNLGYNLELSLPSGLLRLSNLPPCLPEFSLTATIPHPTSLKLFLSLWNDSHLSQNLPTIGLLHRTYFVIKKST